MDDYTTPIEYLIKAMMDTNSNAVVNGDISGEDIELDEQKQNYGYMLILYLSLCLSGRAFPSGNMPKLRVAR